MSSLGSSCSHGDCSRYSPWAVLLKSQKRRASARIHPAGFQIPPCRIAIPAGGGAGIAGPGQRRAGPWRPPAAAAGSTAQRPLPARPGAAPPAQRPRQGSDRAGGETAVCRTFTHSRAKGTIKPPRSLYNKPYQTRHERALHREMELK